MEQEVQGPKIFRSLTLFFVCLWLLGCGTQVVSTPTPVYVEVPVEVPVEVTRIVAQQVSEEIVAAPSPAPNSYCATKPSGEGIPVTIGAILPLSLPGAMMAGFSMQTALNLAVTEINDQGGINGVPVRLVTYDSAGSAERSTQFTERLILLDCAVGIVGLYHNSEALAAAEVAHRYGVPLIVTEAGADEITALGYAEVFRLAPADSMLADVPVQWLMGVGDYNQDGVVSATIIAGNTTSSTAFIQTLQRKLVDNGIKSDILRVDLPSSDFSPVIARLVAQERLPDVIIIAIRSNAALRLQAQLLGAGIGPHRSTLIIQTFTGLDSDEFWQEVPKGAGTIIMHRGPWPSTSTERGQEFARKYERYLERWPEPYAFATYDAVHLLAVALAEAPSWRGSDLITTLEQMTVMLSSGEIAFAYTDHFDEDATLPTYLWHQWADDQVLFLQYAEANLPATDMPVIWPPQHRSVDFDSTVLSPTP